jgi:hypothetical protein
VKSWPIIGDPTYQFWNLASTNFQAAFAKVGGTISYGITGLFLGPIVLAVIWELLVAWIREREGV